MKINKLNQFIADFKNFVYETLNGEVDESLFGIEEYGRENKWEFKYGLGNERNVCFSQTFNLYSDYPDKIKIILNPKYCKYKIKTTKNE